MNNKEPKKIPLTSPNQPTIKNEEPKRRPLTKKEDWMEIKSCSISIPEYNVPGNLFLENNWEEKNSIYCGVLTLYEIGEKLELVPVE